MVTKRQLAIKAARVRSLKTAPVTAAWFNRAGITVARMQRTWGARQGLVWADFVSIWSPINGYRNDLPPSIVRAAGQLYDVAANLNGHRAETQPQGWMPGMVFPAETRNWKRVDGLLARLKAELADAADTLSSG